MVNCPQCCCHCRGRLVSAANQARTVSIHLRSAGVQYCKEVMNMALLRKVLSLVMLCILSAVPELHAAAASPVADLPYRHSAFDFKYAWKTAPLGQGTAIDGVVKNVRYFNVDGAVLSVSLLNGDSKVLAEATALPIPQEIRMDGVRSFDVVLKGVTLSPGDRLRFLVLYRAADGADGVGLWLSSFTVDATTGAVLTEKAQPAAW